MEGHRGLPAGPDGSLDGSIAPGLYASAGPAVKPRRGKASAVHAPGPRHPISLHVATAMPEVDAGRQERCLRPHA